MALDTAERAARRSSRALADHGLAGLGLRHRLRARARCPRRWSRRRASAASRCSRCPTRCRSSRVTEQAFTRLVNEQYALLQRSIAAQERLQRIVLVRARPRRDRRRARDADRRHGARLRRPRRAAGAAHASAASSTTDACAALGERAARARPPRRRPRFVPGHPSSRRARSRCRSARRDAPDGGGVPQAWLVAVKDAGGLAEIDRLILHQAVTVVALELLRRRVADTTERRLAGDVLVAPSSRGELDGRRARPPARAVRARRPRRRARARAGASAAARRPARRRSPRRCAARPSAGSSPRTGRFVCALLPGFLDDELFELGRARRRARRGGDARRRALAAGAGRAVAAGDARREAYHEARCALEAREMLGARPSGAGAQRRRRRAEAAAGRRDLPRPRLLPAAALAAGLRRAAALLRLAARADRERRGPLRRRADALARGVHRVQRPVGGGRAAALLPPPHAALPDPQDRGAHRPRPRLARATASSSGSPCAAARSSARPTPTDRPRRGHP